MSPPPSPGLNKQAGVTTNGQDVSSSNTLPADMPKKRRAPLPPMGASQSVPSSLSTCHLTGPQVSSFNFAISNNFLSNNEGILAQIVEKIYNNVTVSLQRSAESTLRSTKRRAPPPPCANSHQEPQADAEVKGKIFIDD